MINWDVLKVILKDGIPSNVLYGSLAAASVLILVGILLNGIRCKGRYVLWMLLIEYLFLVACSTVICRVAQPLPFAKLQLMPFWTYRAVINHTSGVSVWDIVLNVILFLPLGVLVKLLYPSLPLGKMLLIAIICSLCIETSQYIFDKGIAQFDDVMHNAIGAGIGWGIAKGVTWTLSLLIVKNNENND